MEKMNHYRDTIKAVITRYAQYKSSVGEVDTEVIFDDENDHYELLHNGWIGIYRVHGAVLHLDIRNGKIWIQHDGTEEGVAGELVDAGIPRSDIVLAFKHPSMRPDTEFAVA